MLVPMTRAVSCLFFFSSRRRHTRYWRDWSSDVCSSDLNLREHKVQTGPAKASWRRETQKIWEIGRRRGLSQGAEHSDCDRCENWFFHTGTTDRKSVV